MKTIIILTIDHNKPLPKGINEVVADRAYNFCVAKSVSAHVDSSRLQMVEETTSIRSGEFLPVREM